VELVTKRREPLIQHQHKEILVVLVIIIQDHGLLLVEVVVPVALVVMVAPVTLMLVVPEELE
tara:strand:+ start:297 stop:482 length:186 start_codon:yes stop_codon:yes gene_type:complete